LSRFNHHLRFSFSFSKGGEVEERKGESRMLPGDGLVYVFERMQACI
jgi:hypothetical protein